jgi:hypothetical protein
MPRDSDTHQLTIWFKGGAEVVRQLITALPAAVDRLPGVELLTYELETDINPAVVSTVVDVPRTTV